MRYNPPPNWPPPPPGWEPGPTWTPNPAWPPPPPGWPLFLDDDPAPAPAASAAIDPAADRPRAAVPPTFVEIAADQLSVDHLGARALATWDDENRYKIGTIIGVSADPATVTVQLSGSEPIAFPLDPSRGGPTTPRLHVST